MGGKLAQESGDREYHVQITSKAEKRAGAINTSRRFRLIPVAIPATVGSPYPAYLPIDKANIATQLHAPTNQPRLLTAETECVSLMGTDRKGNGGGGVSAAGVTASHWSRTCDWSGHIRHSWSRCRYMYRVTAGIVRPETNCFRIRIAPNGRIPPSSALGCSGSAIALKSSPPRWRCGGVYRSISPALH